MRVPIVVLWVAAAALLGGCGGDAADPAPSGPPERRVETADPLPELPRGWHPHVNRGAGFALGRPPGWSARDRGIATRLVAPDRLVAVTVAADRTSAAVGLAPAELARATIAALPGYEEPLEAAPARPFRHRYRAAEARASGVAAASGVRQDVRVVAINRGGIAALTAVIAANAERPAARPEQAQALRALRTLRTRPIG